MAKEIGALNLTVKPEALRSAIENGRLLEMAETMGKEAALQISAQLVQHVAEAALKPELMKTGVTASVSFVFEEGDFGTVPHRPHFGVVNLQELAAVAVTTPLTRVAGAAATGHE